MPSLISDVEKAELALVFKDIFDTFKRTIVIHKEPMKVVSQVSNQPMAGYGEDSEERNVSYVPESKEFYATISYAQQQTEIATQVGTYEVGTVRIKVEEEASNYIKTGKTERIVVDGKSFNKITDDKVQDFLGTRYYVFYIQATT
jgi:hypothetical protein